MHYVELMWDEDVDRAVRAEWDLLAEADLPSQARHTGSSNAPHTSLSTIEHWPDEVTDDDLAEAFSALPLAARLGAPACFGRGPFVLVRTVVVTTPLLDLHARVSALLGTPARSFLAPGAWVPHVTLANRLDADQVGRAVALLARASPPDALAGTVVGARHWDSEARTTTRLEPTPVASGGDPAGTASAAGGAGGAGRAGEATDPRSEGEQAGSGRY